MSSTWNSCALPLAAFPACFYGLMYSGVNRAEHDSSHQQKRNNNRNDPDHYKNPL